jgi:hypothetical protein
MNSWRGPVEPAQLATDVLERQRQSDHDLNVYWYQVTNSREDYADKLRAEFDVQCIIVLIVRNAAFTIANSLLSDLVALLSQSRSTCEEKLRESVHASRVGVVLIAKNELSVPQVSSPVRLPAWWPYGGGQEVMVQIEDLTWRVEAPLDIDEKSIQEVCELLFRVEEELISRISDVRTTDTSGLDRFLASLTHRKESADAFLAAALRSHTKVRSIRSFRPSMTERESLVARLWLAVRQTRPDELHTLADGLSMALGLPEQLPCEWRESIVGLLFRPSSRRLPENKLFAINIFYAVSTGCQLVTVSRHADSNSAYPIPLTRSLSYDLRRSLASTLGVFSALETPKPSAGDRSPDNCPLPELL